MTEEQLSDIESTFFDDHTDRDDLRHNFAKVAAEVRRLRAREAKILDVVDAERVRETRLRADQVDYVLALIKAVR